MANKAIRVTEDERVLLEVIREFYGSDIHGVLQAIGQGESSFADYFSKESERKESDYTKNLFREFATKASAKSIAANKARTMLK